MKYLVEYVLPYEHICRVGVEADSEDAACAKAQERFDNGTLWDDAPDMPLLYDDYEEIDGSPLTFRATECADGQYPEPAVCVKVLQRRNLANRAAELLIEAYRRAEGGHSVDWSDLDEAYRTALRSQGIDPDAPAADAEEGGPSPR